MKITDTYFCLDFGVQNGAISYFDLLVKCKMYAFSLAKRFLRHTANMLQTFQTHLKHSQFQGHKQAQSCFVPTRWAPGLPGKPNHRCSKSLRPQCPHIAYKDPLQHFQVTYMTPTTRQQLLTLYCLGTNHQKVVCIDVFTNVFYSRLVDFNNVEFEKEGQLSKWFSFNLREKCNSTSAAKCGFTLAHCHFNFIYQKPLILLEQILRAIITLKILLVLPKFTRKDKI